MPSRATEFSAGYDLRSNREVTLWPGEWKLIPSGFCWEIPRGWVGFIKDRSGLAYKHGLDTMAGVIDSDYRGEVGIIVRNSGEVSYRVDKGERIAQMVLLPHSTPELIEVDGFSDTARGAGGFGHSGRS